MAATRPRPTPRGSPGEEESPGPARPRRRGAARRAAALLVAACGAARAQPVDAVTVGMPIPLTVTDGGVYAVGEELGIFREERLAVRVVTFQGASVVVTQVASKQVTVGFPLPDPVLTSYREGPDHVPVRYFYNASPRNMIELAVLADSPVRRIADLKGRKIGVGALTWGTIPATRALLRDAGLAPGKDVDIVAVGSLAPGFHALREHRVDALNYVAAWNDLLELSGTKIRRLPYPDAFSKMVNNGFLANEGELKARPDLYARFGRAYTKAMLACEANVRFCVEAFWRRQPETRPKDGDVEARTREAMTLVERRLALMLRTPQGDEYEHGRFDHAMIRAYVRAMAAAGEFPTADIPVEQVFSNDLVREFNRFDAAAVRARARAAR